ncbi:MAG: DNA-3-methyladenine glycosylase, partial [Bacteroidetes bacterium]|nr:DNA-3-methyladenine glycosylase [Bacteroidota bacterium]
CRGIIVETEAYAAPIDQASHAWNNRRTERTETMYMQGGVAYVYLCYGIHKLFNVITNVKDIPHAVLIRAIEPLDGIDLMLKRRRKEKMAPLLTAGPGALSEALGINLSHDASRLDSDKLWIEDRGITYKTTEIEARPRVGISFAGEHADWKYRFSVQGSKWVSKAKT